MESVLKVMKKVKKSRRRGAAKWPNLENKLRNWIKNERKEGKRVSTVGIKFKAKEIAKNDNIENFNAGEGWRMRFMRRQQLSVRTFTSIGQKKT